MEKRTRNFKLFSTISPRSFRRASEVKCSYKSHQLGIYLKCLRYLASSPHKNFSFLPSFKPLSERKHDKSKILDRTTWEAHTKNFSIRQWNSHKKINFKDSFLFSSVVKFSQQWAPRTSFTELSPSLRILWRKTFWLFSLLFFLLSLWQQFSPFKV